MPYDDRELLARLIQCEAENQGEAGMKAVATVVMNRTRITYGEFARVSNGGSVRNIIFQDRQFVCAQTEINGVIIEQNIYNMTPTEEIYAIADWALEGNKLQGVDEALFFYNPYSEICPQYFPPVRIGVIYNRIGDHCFYLPTANYNKT